MQTILISAPYMLPVLDRFRPVFGHYSLDLIVAEVTERLSEGELLPFAGKIDGAVCGDDQFTRRVLEACKPRLKVISKWGTGIDSIDREAAAAFGIKVCNTPGAFTIPVADTVMGYVLAFARQGPWLDREVKAGRWTKIPTRALSECTLGVVGVGAIGKAVIQRARTFGMRILGNDIIEIPIEFTSRYEVEMVPLEELLAHADFITLNCDLNPTSRHLIDRRTLALVRPSAVVINTARGPIIDEAALVEALQRGRLAGAALDVFETEPLPLDNPLRAMENVLLAPHNSNASPTAWERVHWNTIRNLLEGLGISPEGLEGLRQAMEKA
jgi:D-3-phosphoglycerate dehydrogenase